MLRIRAVSETACMVWLGEHIQSQISDQVVAATALIRQHLGPALIDIVPSYASVLVYADINQLDISACCEQLHTLLSQQLDQAPAVTPRRFEVACCYHPEVAPDLNWVSQQTGLSHDAIAQLHSQTIYRVYAIGFAPGFCFLGTLDERLVLPRKDTPRARVEAGSVAIAQQQTAVYPRATPGGWQIIGRSHCDMLALCNDPQQPLQLGDEVQFVPQAHAEYLASKGRSNES